MIRSARGWTLGGLLLLIVGLPACSPRADGRVLDVDGNPQAGCVVGAAQLFDAAGHRVLDGTPVLTRTDGDGHWSLNGLEAGTHLLFAWQPATGSEMPGNGDLIAMAKAFAKGIVPGSGRYARDVTEHERNSTSIGVDLTLGLSRAEGVHLAGSLSGPRLTDRLGYVVSVTVMRGELTGPSDHGFTYEGSGGRLMRTSTFLATADEGGHFDLGWVLSGNPVNVSVSAIPGLSFQLARLSVPLDHDLVDAAISIPRHELRRLRVTGVNPSTERHPHVSVCGWGPGGSVRMITTRPDGELDVLVQAGGTLLQATRGGYASSYVAAEPSIDGSAADIVLALQPEPDTEVTLVDESGEPIAGGWVFVGTEASAGFADPFPIFSVTDDEGRLSLTSFPCGNYPAQLVHEKGSYEEWRVGFEIDVNGSRNTVTVPVSSKHFVYR